MPLGLIPLGMNAPRTKPPWMRAPGTKAPFTIRNKDNILTTTEEETAEALNTFFQSVFVLEGEYESEDKCLVQNKLEDIVFTEQDVEKKLRELQEDKSSGPDDISSKVLKECADKLRKPLAMIFRKSLDEQELPVDWKKASVTPIHKGGDKTEASNFRDGQISFTNFHSL